MAPAVAGQQEQKGVPRSPDHHLPNEQQVGPNNVTNDQLNPDSVWAPPTDAGTLKPSSTPSTKRITFQDISATEWLAHTPAKLVDAHLHTGEAFVQALPKKEKIVVPS